jgi:hypothetical protein
MKIIYIFLFLFLFGLNELKNLSQATVLLRGGVVGREVPAPLNFYTSTKSLMQNSCIMHYYASTNAHLNIID